MPQACTELDSVLCDPQQGNWPKRSGLSGLDFCHKSLRHSGPVLPGFAGGLHFIAFSKYRRKMAQYFPTFGQMQECLHHTHYLAEKEAGNLLAWQCRLKCYHIYSTAFPDAVRGHFCGQQTVKSEPV